MSGAILYILYSGVTRTYDWKLALAFALILTESAVYVLNGRRCPLTQLAQHYGDATGNDLIADLFLPPRLARQIPPVCGGLLVVSTAVLVVNYLLSLR